MWESPVEREFALHSEAIEWIKQREQAGQVTWNRNILGDFQFNGRNLRLIDWQRGIRSPEGFSGAVSVRTPFREDEAKRPYQDGVGPDGLWRYKWQGEDPLAPVNQALRYNLSYGLPFIWFYGIASGQYAAIYPVYLVAEEPEQQQFVVALSQDQMVLKPEALTSPVTRRYAQRTTRQRLHQPVFRARVLTAYQSRCAICKFGHANLLDAAHIIPDRESDGIAVTSNGMAMCKIHHGAYDTGILGIRPDLSIHVRDDILAEVDGPMLKHGIQAHHNQKLVVVPSKKTDRPDAERLERKYSEFLAR